MFPANTYRIRPAAAADEAALRALTGSQPRLGGRILIGEIAGAPAAALSLTDGRMHARPGATALAIRMRIRAAAIRAHERTPSVGLRMRSAVRIAAVPA
jgi:hypothetical protein